MVEKVISQTVHEILETKCMACIWSFILVEILLVYSHSRHLKTLPSHSV